MKYTQELVWDAIYVAIPACKKVRDSGIHLNLPRELQGAAAVFFMQDMSHEPIAVSLLDYSYAKNIVFEAITELQNFGFMTFDGTITKFLE